METKATQLPMISRNAKTGHKLQGSGVPFLFVHNWSYVTNWVYVMLSRIQTQKGLYARNTLSTDMSKYELPRAYTTFIHKLREKTPTLYTATDYEIIATGHTTSLPPTM